MSSTEASSATSTWAASALPRDCLTSEAVSSAPSRFLSAQITVAPNAARPSANERPRPLPAPVTTATLPSRRNRFSSIEKRLLLRHRLCEAKIDVGCGRRRLLDVAGRQQGVAHSLGGAVRNLAIRDEGLDLHADVPGLEGVVEARLRGIRQHLRHLL